MSGDAEKDLMKAVCSQMGGKINYQQLAGDLGMNSAESAYERWRVFKKKLTSGGGKSLSAAAKVKK